MYIWNVHPGPLHIYTYTPWQFATSVILPLLISELKTCGVRLYDSLLRICFCTYFEKGKEKVKTSIYIARFMHQAPLTRWRHWNLAARPLF